MTAAASSAWLAGGRHELVVTVPVRTVSELNERGHWTRQHQRRRQIRTTVGLMVRAALGSDGISGPLEVTLTRMAPSNGLDQDNLVSSQKATVDGIADALGIDDRDPRVTWRYAQERSARGVWAVRIRIVRGGDHG